MSEEKMAIPSHNTRVDTTGAWDNGPNERNVKSPATRSYFSRIYAHLNNGANDKVKASYSFIHHRVDAQGNPGEAVLRALSTGIATLNGGRASTVLRGADRRGVYNHLANHYGPTGRQAPPLIPDSELKSMLDNRETKSAIISAGSPVTWADGEDSAYGFIIDINNESKTALVRKWDLDDEWNPTEEILEIRQDNLSHKTFINNAGDIDGIKEGDLVSFTTAAGEVFGEVVAVKSEGSVISQPQGYELKASQDNPVAEVRMFEWIDDAWTQTSISVVSEVAQLKSLNQLPDLNLIQENDADIETQESDKVTELAMKIAKLILESDIKLDPPAGFSNKPAENTSPDLVDIAAEPCCDGTGACCSKETDAPAEEPAVEQAEEQAELAVAEEESATAAAEDDKPETDAVEESTEVKKSAILSELSVDELREFNNLIKML